MGDLLRDTLNKYYFDLNESTSYSSAKILFDKVKTKFPNVKLKEVRDWISEQTSHQLIKSVPNKFVKNPIVSKFVDHWWSIDLCQVKFPKKNFGVRFVLFCIDNLSKYLWIRKLKNKRQETVLNAFDDIIISSKRKPHILQSDSGSEFLNHLFKDYCKKKDINQFFVKTPRHAALAERVIRTIEDKTAKILYDRKSENFIDFIDKIVGNYNSTVHSRTLIEPKNVSEENARTVFQQLYRKRYPMGKQILNIGDRVRIPRKFFLKKHDPSKFVKSSLLRKFSEQIFTVNKVLFSSPKYKYQLKDEKGDQLKHSFYAEELLKISK